MPSTVPNQRMVAIRKPIDKEELYSKIKTSALEEATKKLNGNALKLWLYFDKNQDGFNMALSRQAACEFTGISPSKFYAAFNELEELGYLTKKAEGSNIYFFNESC